MTLFLTAGLVYIRRIEPLLVLQIAGQLGMSCGRLDAQEMDALEKLREGEDEFSERFTHRSD